jgi:hypothetical protein
VANSRRDTLTTRIALEGGAAVQDALDQIGRAARFGVASGSSLQCGKRPSDGGPGGSASFRVVRIGSGHAVSPRMKVFING